jgi:hypothetical protein
MLRLFSDDDGVAIVVGNQSVSTVETTNSLARITIWPPRNGSQSHSFHIHTTKMWLWLLSSSLPRRYVNFLFRRAPKRFVCFFSRHFLHRVRGFVLSRGGFGPRNHHGTCYLLLILLLFLLLPAMMIPSSYFVRHVMADSFSFFFGSLSNSSLLSLSSSKKWREKRKENAEKIKTIRVLPSKRPFFITPGVRLDFFLGSSFWAASCLYYSERSGPYVYKVEET